MFRNEGLRLSRSVDRLFEGGSIVVVGFRGVGRGEQGFGESVLGNQVLRHDEQELSPDFTNGVDTPVSWLVEGLVGGRVELEVGSVGEVSNTVLRIGGPRTHGVDIRSVPTERQPCITLGPTGNRY